MDPAKVFILLFAILLSGCTTNAAPAQTIASPTTEAIASPTAAAIATRTPSPVPSVTPTPTITPTSTPTPEPTQIIETAEQVAQQLGYENCEDCSLNEKIPGIEGVRRELWSEEKGLMGVWTKDTGWFSTEGWPEIMLRERYHDSGWSEKGIIQKLTGGLYGLNGITDGTIIEDDFEVTDKQGKVLFKNVLSYPFYYLDDTGKLRSVIIPLVADIDGKENYPVCGVESDILDMYWAPKEYKDMKEFLRYLLVGEKGKVVSLALYENKQYDYEKFVCGWDSIWNQYQASWSNEYGDLLHDGSNVLDILLIASHSNSIYDDKIIDLSQK